MPLNKESKQINGFRQTNEILKNKKERSLHMVL